MLELYSLISGSSGNSSLVTDGKTHILIDCGTSGKRIFNALSELCIPPEGISAIVVTHEHIDHTKGVGVVARKLKVPIYATGGTHRTMNAGVIPDDCIYHINADIPFAVGDIEITPFEIPHDAAEPCGFTFTDGFTKAALATDIGEMSKNILSRLYGSKQIILESNHDIDMLRYGDYPFPLKQRILGSHGHLSNESASYAALQLVKNGTEHIMLGHLSEHNNLPEIAMMETFNRLTDNGIRVGTDVTLQVAQRYEITTFNE